MPNLPGSRLAYLDQPQNQAPRPGQLLRPDADPKHGSRLSTSPSLPGVGGPPMELNRTRINVAVPARPPPAVGETPIPDPALRPYGAVEGAVPFALPKK
jgi:hypothetical protein